MGFPLSCLPAGRHGAGMAGFCENDIMGYEHIPVLLKEVVEYLAPRSGGSYFDGTLGGASYARAILEASGPEGRLIGFDVDEAAVLKSAECLKEFGDRAEVERQSYADIAELAAARNLKFDGMVLDLGVSSHQLDEAREGFSFSKEGPLDMRMDKRADLTAEYIVNGYSCGELEQLFKEYGEERFAGRIAREIVLRRKASPLKATKDLEEICYLSYPAGLRHGRTHPATRVFQALRIAVNGELDNLRKFLERLPEALNDGGRAVVVSYHSLEDRIVKESFRGLAKGGGFKILTKKPVVASSEEVAQNPRARSAKLRAIVRNI